MTSFDFLRAQDPILGAVLSALGPFSEDQAENQTRPDDHYSALARIIVGQQLSTHVARAIWNRVAAHFDQNFTPEAVLTTSHDDLRKLGLSGTKARSMHSLAQHVADGTLKLAALEQLPDAEIIREITAVKGLGPWSADIFLMFTLQRPDILPVGDLGIREAVRRLYNLETRPEAAQLIEIAAPWRPHRTLASRYLWKWLDQK